MALIDTIMRDSVPREIKMPKPPEPPKDDNDRATRWVQEDRIYKEQLGNYLAWEDFNKRHPEQVNRGQ